MVNQGTAAGPQSRKSDRHTPSSREARNQQSVIVNLFDRASAERPSFTHTQLQTFNALMFDISESIERIKFLRSMLHSMFDDQDNQHRAEWRFADNMSKSLGWPRQVASISRDSMARFVQHGSERVTPNEIFSYLYIILVCRQFNHPCIRHMITYTLLQLYPDFLRFERCFQNQAVLITEAEVIRLGTGLYRFLDHSPKNNSLEQLSNSVLFQGLTSSGIANGVGNLAVMSIRKGNARGAYIVGKASIASVVDNTLFDMPTRFAYVSTVSGDTLYSRGFVLTNHHGDVYVLQYQPRGLGFNITFLPSEELHSPGGFSRGIILTFDVSEHLGGACGRIALMKRDEDFKTGLIQRSGLSMLGRDHGGNTLFSSNSMIEYLNNPTQVDILAPNATEGTLSSWRQIKEYCKNNEKVDEDEILGYASNLIRSGR